MHSAPFRGAAALIAIALFGCSAAALAGDSLQDAVLEVQHEWAHANYEVTGDGAKEQAFEQIEQRAQELIDRNPDRAEPRIWMAITLSTHAGAKGGLGALGLAKRARDLLVEAEKIDPKAMGGSIYTSLGSLYYKVPGWPLGFGDKGKAESMLQKALALNPSGIDPNYFYADYLYQRGRYQEALDAAQRALAAPDRPDRPLADRGRRAEVRALLDQIQSKLNA